LLAAESSHCALEQGKYWEYQRYDSTFNEALFKLRNLEVPIIAELGKYPLKKCFFFTFFFVWTELTRYHSKMKAARGELS
jgi:hypothetical protein